MEVQTTTIPEVKCLTLDRFEDDRGFLNRLLSQKELKKHGIEFQPVQSVYSFTKDKGALRGMHFQKFPHEEKKLVYCIQGSIFDVVIDLRKESVTYLQWYSQELAENNQKMLYIPEGFAHGFQCLTSNVTVLYFISCELVPQSGAGVKWDDPAFSIQWPLPVTTISNKDTQWRYL